MKNEFYKELLKNYEDYIHTEEAIVVYLVKKHRDQINTKSKWVDVVDSEVWGIKDNKLAFNYFIVELFDRRIHPKFPDKIKLDNDNYIEVCRALTWEAAHKDIEQQRAKGIRGPMYLVTCPLYNVNRGKRMKKEFPFWNEEYGGFDYTGNAPTTTIYKEVDMEPKWEYKLTGVVEIDDRKYKMIKDNYGEYILSRITSEKHVEINWFLEDYQAKMKIKMSQLAKKAAVSSKKRSQSIPTKSIKGKQKISSK